MDTENNFKKYLNDLIGGDDEEKEGGDAIWNALRREDAVERRRKKNVVLAELNEINVKVRMRFIVIYI